jgi:subtilisin family serine protease
MRVLRWGMTLLLLLQCHRPRSFGGGVVTDSLDGASSNHNKLASIPSVGAEGVGCSSTSIGDGSPSGQFCVAGSMQAGNSGATGAHVAAKGQFRNVEPGGAGDTMTSLSLETDFELKQFCSVESAEEEVADAVIASSCGATDLPNEEFSRTHSVQGGVEEIKGAKRESSAEEECRITQREVGPVRASGEVADEYIVRFREYQHAALHRQALEEVGQTEKWQWVERNNPASAFPTDFALLQIERSISAIFVIELRKLSFVKDVSPQMRFTRALMMPRSEEESSAAQSGGSSDSNLEPPWGDDKSATDHAQMKPPGRLQTSMSHEDGSPLPGNTSLVNHGRTLLLQRSQITSMFEAEKLWAKGFTGAKVRMAVFDTGVRADHPHFRNIKERTNWTNEDTLNDNLGHGTFVAGVISSQDSQCLGFAPDVEIYAFRVFTDAQVSYTSWFLDAFNYAIATKMNVLNLSIGGPDYLDSPFVEKVWEMTANNIIMVSAIGNDGPLYGTLNNPADQSDVIGVGGIDYSDHIASFSSRGMSTWELPHGYGRVKPDIVAYGREVIGSKMTTGCKSLSGTSVASPVVAGAVCLLASVVPEKERWQLLNPASMKQALMEGALRLPGPNMFEQGAGRLNLYVSICFHTLHSSALIQWHESCFYLE